MGLPDAREDVFGQDSPRNAVDDQVVDANEQGATAWALHQGRLDEGAAGQVDRALESFGDREQGRPPLGILGHPVGFEPVRLGPRNVSDDEDVAAHHRPQCVVVGPHGVKGLADDIGRRLPDLKNDVLVEVGWFCQRLGKELLGDGHPADLAGDFTLLVRVLGAQPCPSRDAPRCAPAKDGADVEVVAGGAHLRHQADGLDGVATKLKEVGTGRHGIESQDLRQRDAHLMLDA